MMFTGDISFGSILTIITILGTAAGLGRKYGNIEQALKDLLKDFGIHEERDDRRFSSIDGKVDVITAIVDRRGLPRR